MKIITGIASSTHLDAHRERMSREALEGMAAQIKTKYIPLLFNHDPEQQLGVVLYGRVEPMADGEFALVTVSGLFESEEEAQDFVLGTANTVWKSYEHHLRDVGDELMKRSSQQNLTQEQPEPRNLADRLEDHLNSTAIWTDGTVYKVKYLVASVGDLKIHVYRDHQPPHFHVLSKSRGINARFHLETLDLLSVKAGKVTSADQKKIRDFFEHNPDELEGLHREHKRMQS